MSDELVVVGIREHYERIEPAIEQLATCGEFLTIGLNDYAGWYVKRDHDDYDLIEEGYPREGRCATLAKDYEAVRGRIDRSLYALTTYDAPDAHAEWEPCTMTDDGTEWRENAPTPGYADLRGVMVWGDIDLRDELKPQRGELDDDTRTTIEDALAAYAEEYARLYGDDSVVFGLDSVGGAYIMGAPAATVPIADLFNDDADARERVLEALVDRSNDWLADAQQRVEERVDGAADVIDPDWVNNCNRQYKAPLSLHADHDAVVTPLDTSDPTYQLTAFDDVTDVLVDETADWAADLTAEDAADESHAATLVRRLWPDACDDHDDWRGALEGWVKAERERERKAEEARQRARERRRRRKEQMGGGTEGAPLTPFIADVYDAVDAVDIAEIADKHASDEYDTDPNQPKPQFDPSWRHSEGGQSCFVDTDSNTFGDSGVNDGGGPAKLMALGERIITSADDSLSGDDYWQAVDALRAAGYEIPVWTPEAGSQKKDGEEYDQMPYWALRKAAVALGVLPEDAFIRAEGERGGYKKFPGKETYNHALAAVEDAGLDHGREYMSVDGQRPEENSPEASEEHEEDHVAGDGTDGHDREDVSPEDIPEPSPATPESDDGGNDFGSYSALDVEAGGYGYWETDRDGNTYFDRVTNFTFDVDSFLFRDGERLIKLAVVPGTGEERYDLTVPAEVFNDPRRFRDNVVKGLTTTFDGGASDLNELRKLVGGQDAPVRTGTHHMGLHPDDGEFVAPNGVLTATGWDDDPENAYIEREIGAERAFGLDPEDHTDYDPGQVTEMLELLPQSRFSQRFLPAMGWLYAAPLRPYIQQWEGQFNTLHVTGETGAGKSSTLSVLWQLLGMDGEPMACDDTKFALTTSMAATNSIPMWYDEYKPGDMKDWEVDRFQNLMRSTTRGGIATRGNADKSTEEYQLRAPVMISGEQSIQGPAEQRRTIQTRFKDGVKEPGSPTKQAFAQLTGMAYDKDGQTVEPAGYELSDHALAYYQFVLQQPPEKLKDLWADARSYVRDLFATNGITGVDDLPRQGVQTVYFGMTLYRAFAQTMADEAGISPDTLDLPERAELDEALLYIARQFGDEGARKSHMDRFVELTARAATEEYLEEGKHFTLVHAGEPNEQLALKLSSVHDRVSKYVRDHGLEGEDLLNNASDYRDRMAEAADDADSYIVTHSQKTPPLARCARIDTDMAEDAVEFSRQAFNAPARDDEEGESADSDGDDPDGGNDAESPFNAVSIQNAAESATGYQTVTAEIADVQTLGGEDSTTTKATLVDASGAIDLVTWSDDVAARLEALEGQCVAVQNAEVGEFDGAAQLSVNENVTQLTEIQAGVGHTTGDAPDDQHQLDGADEPAVADGGQEDTTDEYDQPKPIVLQAVRDAMDANDNTPAPAELVCEHCDLPEHKVRETLEDLQTVGNVQQMNGGYIPT